jgi:hypothetical protein
MTWAVVLLNGPKQYLTLATVQYDKYGQRNRQHIIKCDSWQQGFEQACNQGFTHALFVKNGTVFNDWDAWSHLLNSYPHQGLVGHIIWHPGQQAYLDDQCWFMDLEQFDLEDFSTSIIQQPVPVRSEKNLHDDYTPMWIKPSGNIETFESNQFGQGLIAKQLSNNRSVVNWNNAARSIKQFEYNDGDAKSWLKDYINLAETQLWVLNNEQISVEPVAHLVTPGAGLYWVLHKCHPDVNVIDIVDISQTQLDFCKHLQDTWDGHDYGQFVWNYIKKNNLVHYELDRQDLTPLERLYFKKQKYFVEYVNAAFEKLVKQAGIDDFNSAWANSKCQINIASGNLAEYVIPKGARAWMSNILNYKYTLIASDYITLLNYEKAN